MDGDFSRLLVGAFLFVSQYFVEFEDLLAMQAWSLSSRASLCPLLSYASRSNAAHCFTRHSYRGCARVLEGSWGKRQFTKCRPSPIRALRV